MDIELTYNTRYSANITLNVIEKWADNHMVRAQLLEVGFKDVIVTGTGKERIATGLWNKPTQRASIPSKVSNIKKV